MTIQLLKLFTKSKYRYAFSQGTAITESINLAKEFYDDEEQTNRVLVILSDGEDHENLKILFHWFNNQE